MAIGRYYPASGDIILDGFAVQMDTGNYNTTGCFILSNRRDNGDGWRYTVRFGFHFGYIGWGGVKARNGSAIGNVTIAGVNSGNFSGGFFGVVDFAAYSYFMLSGTTDIVVPYGSKVQGSVSCVAQNMTSNANWTFGGNVTNGNFDQGSFSPAPIPPKPTFYLDPPRNITATSVYMNASIHGNAETLDYYHMGLWDRSTNTWITRDLGGVRHAGYIQFSKTFTNLNPETYYKWEVFVENPKQEDTGGKGLFYFTTLSWAKMAIKVSGAWRTGIAFIKVNGTWRRSKQTFLKVNGTWRRSQDQ